MKIIQIALIMAVIGCGHVKTHLTDSQKKMITELNLILEEDKFLEGANGWSGYSGCHDLQERKAYSNNIDNCIRQIISQIQKDKLKDELNNIISNYEELAAGIEETHRAETDETEMRIMYFSRIRKIVNQ
ncbi:MAG: hypothetical protein R2852_06875 [Bacteroidia bacterium]